MPERVELSSMSVSVFLRPDTTIEVRPVNGRPDTVVMVLGHMTDVVVFLTPAVIDRVAEALEQAREMLRDPFEAVKAAA